MYKAIREGYVEVYRKEWSKRVINSLRLTDKGVDYIAQRDAEALALIFSRWEETPRGSHSTPDRVARYHSLAKGIVMAYTAGAVIMPAEKPPLLFSLYRDHPVPIDPNTPYFYGTHEIRTAIQEYSKNTSAKGSRIIGVIVQGDVCYCMYDTGRSRMFWLRATEENAAGSIQSMLNVRGFQIKTVCQIVIGNSMPVALKLSCRQANPNIRHFVLSGLWDNCYFITNDHDGDFLLRVMLNKKLSHAVDEAALADCAPPAVPTREYDAVQVSEHRAVMLNYRCDLLSLSHFVEAPEGFSLSPIIRCFDYQVPVVQQLAGPKVEVQGIDRKAFYEQEKAEYGH
jgi:hypothetical protein